MFQLWRMSGKGRAIHLDFPPRNFGTAEEAEESARQANLPGLYRITSPTGPVKQFRIERPGRARRRRIRLAALKPVLRLWAPRN